MKVLVIKTSSLGDVIHTLPAITDAVKAIPNIKFDWVVEEGFAEIPTWHPAVNRVIPVALRRWRKSLWQSLQSSELRAFWQNLRKEKYDLVIDAQGLYKSAAIAAMARGSSIGLDKNSAREPGASWFYQHKLAIKKDQHAVERVRQLFAVALGYELGAIIDYGISCPHLETLPQAEAREQNYLVFLHGTTWDTKHWPEEYWYKLIELAVTAGFKVKLPWGSAEEKSRAERLQKAGADVLPKSSLSELAQIIAGAQACAAVDTGLAHLAAALSVPCISIYGPTNPELTATYAEDQLHLVADFACAPCLQRTCNYKGESAVTPACFVEITPEIVWQRLRQDMI